MVAWEPVWLQLVKFGNHCFKHLQKKIIFIFMCSLSWFLYTCSMKSNTRAITTNLAPHCSTRQNWNMSTQTEDDYLNHPFVFIDLDML